jgi:hypothetical protein
LRKLKKGLEGVLARKLKEKPLKRLFEGDSSRRKGRDKEVKEKLIFLPFSS